VLLIAVTFLACAILKSPAPQRLYVGQEQAVSDDVQLYLAEINRIRGGEGYYQVAAEELVARGFPTRSFFNWRTPISIWMMAALPSTEFARALLIASVLLLLMISVTAACKDDQRLANFGLPLAVSLTSPLLTCFVGHQFVMHEIWAGIAIALSAAAYGIERRSIAVGLGLFALFLRELALPYCGICLIFAAFQHRRSEVTVWLLGIVSWAICYAVHCWMVSQWIAPDAIEHRHGWIQFGGLAFVLGTVQVNYYLLTAPMFVTSIFLTLALVGLADWTSEWGRRVFVTVAVYLAAFCIVGQDFNRYWGYLMSPLLCYGLARAPVALKNLIRAARLWPLAQPDFRDRRTVDYVSTAS
jgi:hypothetical protein